MLSIKNLNKTYSNGVKALNDVRIEIPQGMFGLLGPNGAGKSSLMRTIATLQDPDSGEIYLDEINVLKEKEALRKVLGYLPQEFGSYPRISPLLMLDHFAILKGVTDRSDRKDMVESLLVKVNLYEHRHKAIDTFSGGMKQRFGIAQTLIGSPKLIIVDEPTAGLDPQERHRFNNLLVEIGENITVILSTHIVDDVADLCPQMAIFGSGRVLEQGNPEKLIAKLQGCLWKKSVPREALPEIQENFQVLSLRLFAGKTIVYVVSEHCPDVGFEPLSGGLEEVYFSTLANNKILVAA